MKNKITLALSVLIFLTFCTKSKKRLPLVTTTVTSASVNEATCSGVLYSAGDGEIIEMGIYWGISPTLTVNDNKVISETKEKNFTTNITGLEANTVYYAKTFARNEFGVSYGKVVSFKTVSVNYPTLALYNWYAPTANSIDLTLQVNQNLSSTYTTGICWSTSQNPTLLNNKVVVTERFTTDLVPFYQTFYQTVGDLEEATTYYARAYATSPYGTVYSNPVSWTTIIPVNPVSFVLSSVAHTSVACEVFVSGGAIDLSTVKTIGVCWSKNPNPTQANNKAEQPYVANNSNTFNLQTLEENTTYYFRTYLKTNTKTTYSPDEKAVRTFKGTVTDINGNIYNTIEIGGLEWMTSNLKVTSFNNGTPISLVSNYNQWVNSVNSQLSVYCNYGDNPSNSATYGRLYPRYVAENINLPPAGWRIASINDWQQLLYTNLTDLCIKNGSWQSSEITNAYGFSLYASGCWENGYRNAGTGARFWAQSSGSSANTIDFSSYNNYTIPYLQSGNGQSVRCVKN